MTKTSSPPAGRGPGLEFRRGTMGALEARAGLPADFDSRFALWMAFKNYPDPIAAGVAALRAWIAAQPEAPDPMPPDTAIPKE